MGKRGPERQWSENMVARFAAGTFDRIETVIEKAEDRTAFIRAAVEREIAWRLRRKRPDKKK